jgi:hypothetical protein
LNARRLPGGDELRKGTPAGVPFLVGEPWPEPLMSRTCDDALR